MLFMLFFLNKSYMYQGVFVYTRVAQEDYSVLSYLSVIFFPPSTLISEPSARNTETGF